MTVRPNMSVPETARLLGVGAKKVRDLYRTGVLSGYPVTTTGPAERVHAIRIYTDSAAAYQHRQQARNPIRAAQKGRAA